MLLLVFVYTKPSDTCHPLRYEWESMGESGTGDVNLFCKDHKCVYLRGPDARSSYSTLALRGSSHRQHVNKQVWVGASQICLGT